MIRRLAAALALVAIGISVPVAMTPAQSASWYDGPCTDNIGITVVIDFQELVPDSPANVRCVPGAVTSGLNALDQAAVTWESARRFPGLICRIAGKPGTDTESCINAPPLNAFWGYWLAPRGGQWCYSDIGAGSRTPPPGTVEGWSFSLDKASAAIPPPRFAPPAPIDGQAPNPLNRSDCRAAANPPPTPTTTPTPTPTPTTTPTATTTPTTTAPPTPTATAKPPAVPPPTTPVAPQPTTEPAPANPSAVTSTSTARGVSVASSTTSPVIGGSIAAASSTSAGDDIGALAASTTPVGTPDPTGETTLARGTVDLGDDGRGGSGFGAATVIGIAVAAGLIGAGTWAARRRRMLP